MIHSRQACCSGLGKRASAAPRDYKSGIKSRARSNTSTLQPLPAYEILHEINHYPFDFANVHRVDCDRFGPSTDMESTRQETTGDIRQSACVHLSTGDFPTNDLTIWCIC